MATDIDLDRRRPQAGNHVFEAHDWHDPTNRYLNCFRDMKDAGVYVTFCGEPDAKGESTITDMIWIDAAQCEQFAAALLEAAKVARQKG